MRAPHRNGRSRQPGRGRQPGGHAGLAAACLAVFTLTVGCGLAWPYVAPSLSSRHRDSNVVQVVRVIDGDTFVIADGEHVRIENIDTAEMPPRALCAEEARLALAAKARLQALVRGGDEIVLAAVDRDRDPYGRLLRRVRIDERDVGELLVGEGLAQRWRGRKASWC